jgi:tetratricopeptide (TPR) repeat protein
MSDAARSQEGPSLVGVRVALAGRLAGMSRREAQRLIREHGGIVLEKADATVEVLVVSDELSTGAASQARPRGKESVEESVRAAIDRGEVQLIGETELWRRLGLVDSERDIQRLYTPAMLANLLRVDVAVIRRWQRRGLLQPVRCVRRLAYFDFAQVVVARQLAELHSGGTSPSAIERQWLEWNRHIASGPTPLADFAITAGGNRLLRKQGDSLVESTGQRWFPFVDKRDVGLGAARPEEDPVDEPVVALPLTASGQASNAPTPEMLTEMAEELESQGELAAAIDLYHAALAAGGPNADVCFALAELFYRLGDLTASRERYFMAIELDESFVEARVNLGCLLAEQGQLSMAVAAIEGALRFHPDYADAHYHLAKTLHELDRRDDALPHWEAFLTLAPDSPWAAEVRLLLALAGKDIEESR